MAPIKLFVPGRLCLFGEHSDWAGMYRTINPNIEKGLAIVTGIEQGIYATAEISDRFIMCGQGDSLSNEHFECEMDSKELLITAQKGGYYSYVAGVASYMKDHYVVGGIKVTITKRDIPIKSGLSSSAAICVLVARAFNRLYDLNLSTEDEMRVAFRGEQRTPSRCGRLDQACAFGGRPVLMEFDGDQINTKELQVGGTFHWVVANLMSSKNTIKILGDLNRSFPFASKDADRKLHEALGIDNRRIVLRAAKLIEMGDAKELGALMNEAERNFDEKVMPACDELKAPVLHSLLNDPAIAEWSFGARGVGSHGDGMIQILAKSKRDSEQLKIYLKEKKNMPSVSVTIRPSSKIILAE